ncbi:hypothetical protein BASA81_011245 [Batrachochytrium salamandrivorans]|nr:hypothetical protein BASA81_011245 [Batrachochytrium salamandrivorans]
MSLRLVVLLALCLWLGAMANVNFDDIADDEDLQEIVRYGAFPAPDYQGLIKEIETCGTNFKPTTLPNSPRDSAVALARTNDSGGKFRVHMALPRRITMPNPWPRSLPGIKWNVPLRSTACRNAEIRLAWRLGRDTQATTQKRRQR